MLHTFFFPLYLDTFSSYTFLEKHFWEWFLKVLTVFFDVAVLEINFF